MRVVALSQLTELPARFQLQHTLDAATGFPIWALYILTLWILSHYRSSQRYTNHAFDYLLGLKGANSTLLIVTHLQLWRLSPWTLRSIFYHLHTLDNAGMVEALLLILLTYRQHLYRATTPILLSFYLVLSIMVEVWFAGIPQGSVLGISQSMRLFVALLKAQMLFLHEKSKWNYLNKATRMSIGIEESSGLWSQLFGFPFLSTLFIGYRGQINLVDLQGIPPYLTATNLLQRFQQAWHKYNPSRNKLMRVSMLYNLSKISQLVMCGVIASALHISVAFLIEDLVRWADHPNHPVWSTLPIKQHLIIATISSFGGHIIIHGFKARCTLSIQTSLQGSLSAAIFAKVPALSDAQLARFAKLALVKDDLLSVVTSVDVFYSIISNSLQAAMYSILLWPIIGSATLWIILITLGSIYISARITFPPQPRRRRRRATPEARLKLANDLLANFRNIKLRGLEAQFEKAFRVIRSHDMELYKTSQITTSARKTLVFAIGSIIPLFSYSTGFIPNGPNSQQPNLPLFFRALTLTVGLSWTTSNLWHSLEHLKPTEQSFSNIQNFLSLPEEKSRIKKSSSAQQQSRGSNLDAIALHGVSVALKLQSPSILTEVNLKIPKGSTTIICGNTGSGKSVLLNTLIRRTFIRRGKMEIDDTAAIGYSSQTPWLQSGSIKDNIIGCNTFDEAWYSSVKEACILSEEIALLPSADTCVIDWDRRDINHALQQRICLARAVYSRAAIQVLDDPLNLQKKALVDRIIANLLGQSGLLKEATVVLATSKPLPFYFVTDQAFAFDSSHHLQLLTQDAFLERAITSNTSIISNLNHIPQEPVPSNLPDLQRTSRMMSSELIKQPHVNITYQKASFHFFFRNIPIGIILAWFLLSLITSLIESFPAILFQVWLDLDLSQGFPISYTALIAGLSGGTYVCMELIFYLYIIPQCSNNIFNELLQAMVRAPISSLDNRGIETLQHVTIEGLRIITHDLPITLFKLMIFLTSTIVVWTIVFSCHSSLVLLLPLTLLSSHLLKCISHRISRQLHSMNESFSTRVHSAFVEAVAGVAHINALKWHVQYTKWSHEFIDNLQATFYYKEGIKRCMDTMLSLVITSLAIVFVSSSLHCGLAPHRIGFLMTAFLDIAKMIELYIPLWLDLETGLTNLQEIRHFIESNSQLPEISSPELPSSWPAHGAFTFNNVAICSRQGHLLRSITFSTLAQSRIGIHGPSKSGTSAILLSLLNQTPYTGSIEVDGVEIRTIPPQTIQSRFTIIPERPVIFPGTVRQNLLPRELLHRQKKKSLESIMEAVLRSLSLFGAIKAQGGFRQQMANVRLSPAQLQRFALAQAAMSYFIKRTSVILIDGAMSDIDTDSHRLMDNVISQIFANKTVLTTAHSSLSLQESTTQIEIQDDQAIVKLRPMASVD